MFGRQNRYVGTRPLRIGMAIACADFALLVSDPGRPQSIGCTRKRQTRAIPGGQDRSQFPPIGIGTFGRSSAKARRIPAVCCLLRAGPAHVGGVPARELSVAAVRPSGPHFMDDLWLEKSLERCETTMRGCCPNVLLGERVLHVQPRTDPSNRSYLSAFCISINLIPGAARRRPDDGEGNDGIHSSSSPGYLLVLRERAWFGAAALASRGTRG